MTLTCRDLHPTSRPVSRAVPSTLIQYQVSSIEYQVLYLQTIQIIAIIGIISLYSIHPPLHANIKPSDNYKTSFIPIRASYAYVEMDADHLDVCAIYNMEFQRLYADMCRLQSETNNLVKRIQRATPYDVINKFGTKLQTLCEMLKYTLERLRESPHHPWRQTPTMQQLLARRQMALDYYRAQYEGPLHVYVDGAEDEID